MPADSRVGSLGPIDSEELHCMLRAHLRFYSSGGGGGRWQVFDVAGMTMGVYQAITKATAGAQADLSGRRFEDVDLRDVRLPFANLASVHCTGQDLTRAVLMGSLVVDGDFSGSRFDRAILTGADLSRTNLAGCSFRGANLSQADLEDADLTGADLTGAILDSVRLQGAKLDGVIGVRLARLEALGGSPTPSAPRQTAGE